MRLDIYQRAEHDGIFSYLAVPEGKIIPAEATNVDWQVERRGFAYNETDDGLADLFIERPMQQISEKGYAITCLKNMVRRH